MAKQLMEHWVKQRNEDIKKLEKIFDTLSDLYEDAVKVDNDCASAISTAEDTIAMTIKFLKKGGYR